MATELTVLGRTAVFERRLGRGATGDVWLVRTAEGERWVLKFARDRASYARLADEGERLLGVDSPWCVRLLGAGVLTAELKLEVEADRVRLARGTPYLVLEHRAGTSLDVAQIAPEQRGAVALCVARDVGRALSDLHAAAVAHGDVKSANVLFEPGPRWAASLMDFGLSSATDEVVARGGTRRYLAPETFQPRAVGDARLRDLYALGVLLTELVVPDLAEGEAVLPALVRADLDSGLKGLIQALLSPAPAARPHADWVVARALSLLQEVEPVSDALSRRQGLIRRTYIGQRRHELVLAARTPRSGVLSQGVTAEWLAAALERFRAVEELRGSLGGGEELQLSGLDAVGQARWLVELVGPAAAAWPEIAVRSDAELAERLLAAAERREPRLFTLADLEGANAPLEAEAQLSVLALASQLGRGGCSARVLDAAEAALRDGTAPRELAVSLGGALRLRGQLGRALSVLSLSPSAEAALEAAEVQRRAGDASAAAEILEVARSTLPAQLVERANALEARLALDRGEAQRALDQLTPMPRAAAALEVRALAEIALGQRDGAHTTLERLFRVAEGDEERARAAAVAGNLAHFAGDAEAALLHFRRAAEHAAHAGAVLEEATYLTGWSAAAAHVGELISARHAARRALLLFESLGRQREAARAELSLAAVSASLGAELEARDSALAAVQRAKLVGDKRCRGYAHLILADVLPAKDSEGVEHARSAAALLEDADDALRAAARLHERGDGVDLDELDGRGLAPGGALDAQLEWWTARARSAALSANPVGASRVLDALLACVGRAAPCALRGPAFAAGAELASRVSDGDAARRLTHAASEAARELLQRAGQEAQAVVRLLPWVRAMDSSHPVGFSPEQLLDVDRLVRALGRRDRLRPLLDQIVDALVLWTGVERGMLLLRAPHGKLRARAGRNLQRADLHGAQLELSHSLAERALAQGEPVVAVDAAFDLPAIHESVHALKLRSVLAVPLIARGEALGVVYLDDRMRRGAFGPRELSWVRLVSTLAALAIADARDQILLRRAARRARRAEARLGTQLARREAELDRAERELARTRDGRETRFAYDDIVGRSEATREMLKLVDRVALSEVPVLLIGESGSGKELIARAIHRNGSRASQAFVAENCGAIPETLLESTLFGHVRGAFTGAQRPRAGLFDVAHGGTLLLDEIGEMSLGMQAKLLRALQDGEIKPVGAERSRRVDVRVIGATHRDLAGMVAGGKFREDLYYRLNVISVKIPSLRQRSADVPLLVKHFLDRYASGRDVQVSKAAMDLLTAFPWPGNVRQLENEVRRALVLSDGLITPEHLSAELAQRGDVRPADELNLRQRLDQLEVELVRVALRRTDGNQTRAAELLGVSRFGLQKMMKRLEISVPTATS